MYADSVGEPSKESLQVPGLSSYLWQSGGKLHFAKHTWQILSLPPSSRRPSSHWRQRQVMFGLRPHVRWKMWQSGWETNVFQNARDFPLFGDTHRWNCKKRNCWGISRNPDIIHLTAKLVVAEISWILRGLVTKEVVVLHEPSSERGAEGLCPLGVVTGMELSTLRGLPPRRGWGWAGGNKMEKSFKVLKGRKTIVGNEHQKWVIFHS